MTRLRLVWPLVAGLLVVAASAPAWATDPPPNPTVDLTGPLQSAQNTLITMMQQAFPFLFTIFASVVGIALVMRLISMVAGNKG